MEKISLNRLMEDYFKDGDTVTVSANALQRHLRDINYEITKQKIEIDKLSLQISNMEASMEVLKYRNRELAKHKEFGFFLDLNV